MTDKPQPKPIELRDTAGRLYGKLAGTVLEVKRGDRVVRFDLLTGREIRKPLDSRDSPR